MRSTRMVAGSMLLGGLPLPATAHSFGKLYTLPVPVWMYLYAATAALVLSFLMIGYFIATPAEAQRNFRVRELPLRRRGPGALPLRGLGVTLLLLSIVSGFVGSADSYANFNMTFFWIVVLLGYAYWVALCGNGYDRLNPWQALVDVIERFAPGSFDGRRRYPAALACYPALLLYMLLVWIELFGHPRPLLLSWLLIAYTLISLGGAWHWGRRAWFEYGDLFGVLFRLLGKIAPLQRVEGRWRLRQPFVGLLDEPCPHASLLLFILFMLSSTAFDGLHETAFWMRLYWQDTAMLLKPVLDTDAAGAYALLKPLHLGFQSLALLLSPLLYLAAYVAVLWLARRLVRTPMSLRRLCLEFGYSLLPIALAYHLAHYYTLAVGQGAAILRLISDPFGYGWNLFGTATWFTAPIILDAGAVWHTQVTLILLGHIVSVYLAHLVALRLFPGGRAAVISQLPMLVLMVLYTTVGLWILSLPIQNGVWVPT